MALFYGKLDPTKDGVTHINIYSHGRTELGRFLTNFAHTPIVTEDGSFASVEGYWYWLGTHDNRLRTLYGFKAKQLGRNLPNIVTLPDDEFERKIRLAITCKLLMYPERLQELAKCELPLAHYYVFSGVVRDAGFKWMLEHIDSIRNEVV